MEKITVIVPAAGLGSRLGLGKNKAFANIGGLPLLVQCLRMLEKTGYVNKVIAVVGASEVEEAKELLLRYLSLYNDIEYSIIAGGTERQYSVENALKTLPDTEDLVAIHDGARPFVDKDMFERVLAVAKNTGAAVVAVPVKDTIKVIDASNCVVKTLSRSELRAVQTPQIFRVNLLKRAYAISKDKRANVTDDASLVEMLGESVTVVDGDYENIKVTTPEDLILAEKICKNRGLCMNEKDIAMPQFRIGSGFDVHKFALDRKLILCGLEVPYELGLLGHSDADVALHALSDALLGAAGLGDIGKHFPDTDMKFKDADSMVLLRDVVELLNQRGWVVNNADVTIMAQQPKLANYIPAMAENIARAMKVNVENVNVKATTTEKLGFVGRGEGMASEAVVSIVKA